MLDDLHEGKPYSVTVAMIDVDDLQEREINIKLNSEDLQGQYDLSRLNDLAREVKDLAPDADLASSIGMSEQSLENMGIDADLWLDTATPLERAVEEDSNKIAGFRELRTQHKKKKREEDLRVQLSNIIVKFPNDMSLDKISELRTKFFTRLEMRPDINDPFLPFWRIAAALGMDGVETPEDEEV